MHRPAALLLAILGLAGPLASSAAAQSRKLNGRLAPLPEAAGGARNFEFAFTPDGTRVLYRGTDAAGSWLYGAPADGSALATRLSSVQASSFQVSPDGRHVAFVGDSMLHVVPSDGSAATVSLGISSSRFAFTPDSTRLVSIGNDLRVTPLDGSAPVILGTQIDRFQITPDGSQIVYITRQGPPGSISEILWRRALDGASPSVQLSVELSDLDFRISADGTRVVYNVPSDLFPGGLYSARLDGPPTQTQLASFVSHFAIDNDSTAVVYTGWTAETESYGLYEVPVDGGPTISLSGALVEGGNVEGSGDEPPFAISADDGHVVYRADQEVDGVFALYSASLHALSLSQGGAVRRIDPPGVGRFALTADGERVMFEAADTPERPVQLYSAPIRLPHLRRAGGGSLSTAPLTAVRLSGAMPEGGGVVAFALRSDARGVVYTARQDSLSVELFSVSVDGRDSPVKLNAPLPAQGDVDGIVAPAFRIDPTGRLVLYRADQVFDEVHELFLVPVDGAEPPSRVSPALEPAAIGGDVGDFRLDERGEQVIYTGDGERDDVLDLFSVPLAGGPFERVNQVLPPEADVDWSSTELSPDGRWLVYEAGPDPRRDLFSADLVNRTEPLRLTWNLPGLELGQVRISADSTRAVFVARHSNLAPPEIYSVPLDGSASAVQISAAQSDSSWEFELTQDSRRIVFSGPEVTDKRELFSAPIDGSAPPIRLSGPMSGARAVVASNTFLDAFQLGAGGRWIVFLADRDADSTFHLYGVPADGSAPPVRLSGPMVQRGDVTRFAIAGERLLYVADQEIDGRFELYSASLFGAPPVLGSLGPVRPSRVKLNGALVPGSQAVSFVFPPHGESLFFYAEQVGDSGRGLYEVALDGRSPARRILSTDGLSGIVFSPDARRVVYSSSHENGFTTQLYSLPIDGSQPAVRLNGHLVNGGNVVPFGTALFQVTPDSRTVVYLADARQNERFELFAVDVAGASAPVVLNGPLPQNGDVGTPSATSQTKFRITADGHEVVYVADQDEDEVLELYASPLP